MIPRTIHYFWFGRTEKPELVLRCIESFKVFAPDCEIKEWNEDNFDVSAHPYTKAAYAEKKWAFVSDYARLKVLFEEGGIYLDTDMLLVKEISPLFAYSAFLGKEDDVHLSAGIIGSVPGHGFIGDVLKAYDSLTERIPIPRILTDTYRGRTYDMVVFHKEYFYPFSAENIHLFKGTNIPKETYAVHMWNYSWGNPIIKLAKKLRIHRMLVSVAEFFGIKKKIKKMLGSE